MANARQFSASEIPIARRDARAEGSAPVAVPVVPIDSPHTRTESATNPSAEAAQRTAQVRRSVAVLARPVSTAPSAMSAWRLTPRETAVTSQVRTRMRLHEKAEVRRQMWTSRARKSAAGHRALVARIGWYSKVTASFRRSARGERDQEHGRGGEQGAEHHGGERCARDYVARGSLWHSGRQWPDRLRRQSEPKEGSPTRPVHREYDSGGIEAIEPAHLRAPTGTETATHFTSYSPRTPRFQSHSASATQDLQRPLIQGRKLQSS